MTIEKHILNNFPISLVAANDVGLPVRFIWSLRPKEAVASIEYNQRLEHMTSFATVHDAVVYLYLYSVIALLVYYYITHSNQENCNSICKTS